MDKRYFSKKVAEWFEMNKRDLPWRACRDPYQVWLSEIILQQTRVSQGLPYYMVFIKNFPSIHDLAAAPEQKVLRLWQGLGYYTRARNLHACAKTVVREYNGTFPSTFEALKKLPGIGDYTAAAIASIAFQEPVAVVDGNVFRVLARLLGVHTPVNSPAGKREFFEHANALMDPAIDPGIYNQAIMEFGALHCTPQNPLCDRCPFSTVCIAARENLQDQLPVKQRAKAARHRHFYYFVIQKGQSLFMRKRTTGDIWSGLFDFYLVEKERPTALATLMKGDKLLRSLTKSNPQPFKSEVYKHVLSHQIIFSTFVRLRVNGDKLPATEGKFYSPANVAELPKPVLISRFLHDERLLK